MKALINSVELAFDDVGRGVPILWVHGYPLNRTMWEPQTEGLADAARHISVDLRGFGDSLLPFGPTGMDAYADDLAGLLDALNVTRVVLAGVSMGGYIAMAFARRFADRLLGLILADTRAGPDSPEGAAKRRTDAERVLKEGTAPVVAPMLEKLLGETTRSQRPQVVASVKAMLASARPDGVQSALLAMAERPDSLAGLGDVNVPALILVGSEDVITPPAESRRMSDAMSSASLVEIPRAGHLSNMEEPEHFNRAVHDFVSRNFATEAI